MARHIKKIKKRHWYNRRFFVSLALSDTGRSITFTPMVWQVGLVPVLALGLVAGVIWTEVPAVPKAQADASVPVAEVQALEGQVSDLKQQLAFRDQKINYFAQEVGHLSSRIQHFELISEKLYNDKYVGHYLKDIKDVKDAGANLDEGDMSTQTSPVSLFEISSEIATLSRKADDVQQTLDSSSDLLSKIELSRNLQPHLWPVINERTFVTSPFGWRKNPMGGKPTDFHPGVDLAGQWDAPIVAAADGVVSYVGYRFGYGRMVELTHANGFVTRYAHMDKALVRNNQTIHAGEVVGLMGSSGRSTGPHLHFEVRLDGQPINPLPFIKDGRQAARMMAESQSFKNKVAALKTEDGTLQ